VVESGGLLIEADVVVTDCARWRRDALADRCRAAGGSGGHRAA
jgi:hypothetical protein